MGYFGGLGASKGWLKFLFVVEPEILRDVLIETNAVLVIMNSSVPADYEATPLNEYVDAYSRYLKAMLESEDVAHEATRGIYMGLAASLNQFTPTPYKDTRIKRMECDEPVVNVRPLALYFDAQRGKLCTNVLSNLYFGVELSYPRAFSLARDKHEILYEAEQLPTHGIFEGVKSRVWKQTRPCRIRSSSREHRTPIRITEAMRESMQHHLGLTAAGLQVV